MEPQIDRIVLTGFMGVGKSTVAYHLSRLTGVRRVDLDEYIEAREGTPIPRIVGNEGIEHFREIETECLREVLRAGDSRIISLGGGAWTVDTNRETIRQFGCTSIWLETTFEHCWRNIRRSKKVRPLVENKQQARRLFEERLVHYCLADWHFVIEPGHNSYEVARKIASQVWSVKTG